MTSNERKKLKQVHKTKGLSLRRQRETIPKSMIIPGDARVKFYPTFRFGKGQRYIHASHVDP